VQVYGIDSDREKIEVGKWRYKLPNLHLLHSNKIVGKYNSCTAFFTLHEIAVATEALSSLYEHLEDGGRIMVDDFRKTSKAKYREWYEKGKKEHSFEEEYQKHNRWTVKDFARMCESAGFRTIEAEPRGDFWLFYIGRKQTLGHEGESSIRF
jgi:ubiquinone/menaquinone biosynthesis C-methylase UbiE